jgi:hypothetical protein
MNHVAPLFDFGFPHGDAGKSVLIMNVHPSASGDYRFFAGWRSDPFFCDLKGRKRGKGFQSTSSVRIDLKNTLVRSSHCGPQSLDLSRPAINGKGWRVRRVIGQKIWQQRASDPFCFLRRITTCMLKGVRVCAGQLGC